MVTNVLAARILWNFKHHEHEKKKNGAEAPKKASVKEPQKFNKNRTMAN